MQQSYGKRRRTSESQEGAVEVDTSILETPIVISKNKSIQIGWLIDSGPCVVISSSEKTVKFDQPEWVELQNEEPAITDYFNASVKPPYVKSSIKFLKFFGKPHITLGEERVALNASDWKTITHSFKQIQAVLDFVDNQRGRLLNDLSRISQAFKDLNLNKVSITFGKNQFSTLRIAFPKNASL